MRRILRGHNDGRDYAESLQIWGVEADARDFADDVYQLWPENGRAVEVFQMLGTQWNVGMGGAIGMRYEALPFLLRTLGIKGSEQRDVFDGLRLMEGEALRIWREGKNG